MLVCHLRISMPVFLAPWSKVAGHAAGGTSRSDAEEVLLADACLPQANCVIRNSWLSLVLHCFKHPTRGSIRIMQVQTVQDPQEWILVLHHIYCALVDASFCSNVKVAL